jgi:hypothetical protein
VKTVFSFQFLEEEAKRTKRSKNGKKEADIPAALFALFASSSKN